MSVGLVPPGDLGLGESTAGSTSAGDRVRFVLRGIGQSLITLGVVVLLFVVYEVWVTNIVAARAQAVVKKQLATQWTTGRDPLLPLPDGSLPALPDGHGIANLFIPRLGRDYAWTIVQGTSAADLEKGPGHYLHTALPGTLGNFAVAGHRVGKGEPFLNIDHLRVGDPIIVQTESHWYVYRVKGRHGDLSAAGRDGVPGREIIDPGQADVIDPVPDHPGAKATEALMTMTTCHPKFTANQRMVVYSVLVRTVRSNGATMPGSIASLYGAG